MIKDLVQVATDYPTEPALAAMVETHYDNGLFGLEGEIYFDDELSRAEIGAAVEVLTEDHRRLPPEVYLPCAGTLRHAVPLLDRGVRSVVAVDLSQESIKQGRSRYGHVFNGKVSAYVADIRDVERFCPQGGFELALLLGNSFGDVTDPEGHREFIQALADSLKPGGRVVFDYVGHRYNPLKPDEVIESEWSDVLVTDNGSIPVIDRRSRCFEPREDRTGVLGFTCRIEDAISGGVLTDHEYSKLVVPDDILYEQFLAAGMRLRPMGSILAYSKYHKRRVEERDDLGMMGRPNHLYYAVKM